MGELRNLGLFWTHMIHDDSTVPPYDMSLPHDILPNLLFSLWNLILRHAWRDAGQPFWSRPQLPVTT